MATLAEIVYVYFREKFSYLIAGHTFLGILATSETCDRPVFRCAAKSAALDPMAKDNYSSLRLLESIYWILSSVVAPYQRNFPS